MACSRCSAHTGLLRAAFRPAHTVRFAPIAPIAPMIQRRAQSTQPGAGGPDKFAIDNKRIDERIADEIKDFPGAPIGAAPGTGVMGSYALYRGTEELYKTVAEPAAYSISVADRGRGEVVQLPDGEEVGVSQGPWHKVLDLPPTFSTWSQVTMLRMYLLVARARNLSPEAYNAFYKQLLDHFFFDSERIMDVNHNLTAKTARQRFLKDIYVQWRGLVAAYDEGLARGDAVLASAVWRNLYKGKEQGMDYRKVAGVVGYIRATLSDLEGRDDGDIVVGKDLFRKSLEGQMRDVVKEVAGEKVDA